MLVICVGVCTDQITNFRKKKHVVYQFSVKLSLQSHFFSWEVCCLECCLDIGEFFIKAIP